MEEKIAQETKNTCGLLDLPRPLIEKEILSRLDPVSLVRLSMTSSLLYRLTNSEMQTRCKTMGYIHTPSPRKRQRANPFGASPRKRLPKPYSRLFEPSQPGSPLKEDGFRKSKYYRHKYTTVACKPLCCLCWSRPGIPHPFFEDRNVCWTCFSPIRFDIKFLREHLDKSNRYFEHYLVFFSVSYQLHGKDVKLSECPINGEYFSDLKYYNDAVNSAKAKWASLPTPASSINSPSRGSSPFSEISAADKERKDLPSCKEVNATLTTSPVEDTPSTELKLEALPVLPDSAKVLESQLEKAYSNLNKFVFHCIKPLRRRSRGDEAILNDTHRLLVNEHLWTSSSSRKLF